MENSESSYQSMLLKLKDELEKAITGREKKSDRLLNWECYFQCVNMYYSCWTAGLSVWSLVNEKKSIALSSVILSIVLVLLIAHINSQRFSARSKDIDASLLGMRNILSEINGCIEKEINSVDVYEKYCKQFNEQLTTCEPPSFIDELKGTAKCIYTVILVLIVIISIFAPIILLCYLNRGTTQTASLIFLAKVILP